MSTTTTRPEDRQRSGRDGEPGADTWPVSFRSEAFAEDLEYAADAPTQGPAPAGAETLP